MTEYVFVPTGGRVTSGGKLGAPLYRAVETAKKPAAKRTRKAAKKPPAEETPKEG